MWCSQHQQLLYTLGAILRTTAAILAARYLSQPESTDARIDHLLLTDLRRPSYGNLVEFLRACAKTKTVEWAAVDPLVLALRRAFNREGHQLPCTRHRKLVDGLIEYRNRFVHSVAAVDSETCRERLPAVQEAIEQLLSFLEVLKGAEIESASSTLILLDTRIPLAPLTNPGGDPCVAIMEGYNSRKGSLHYVSPEREWDCKESWFMWRDQLQAKGLLPIDWERISATWLQRRASASIPEKYRLPDNYVPSIDVLEQVSCCIEPGSPVYTADVELTVALMWHIRKDRHCFIVDDADCDSESTVHGIASRIFGSERDIGNLPEGHKLEKHIIGTTLIFPQPPGALPKHNWQILIADFPGLEIIEVRPGTPDNKGLSFDPNVYGAVYDRLLDHQGKQGSWASLNKEARQWLTSLVRIRFFSGLGRKEVRSNVEPAQLWARFLENSLKDYCLDAVELLASSQRKTADEGTKADLTLRDLGLLQIDRDGYFNVVDESARATIIKVALSDLPIRSRRRVLEELKAPVTPELGATLTGFFDCETAPHPPTSAWQALFAHYVCEEPDKLKSLSSKSSPEDQLQLCSVLISWGRPDAVDLLVREIIANHAKGAMVADELTLNIASAVRSHGSPQLAAELFSQICSTETPKGIQAMHQWAGVLRDRKQAGDQDAAAELYMEILALQDLSPEQILRTSCGAAENEYWRRQFQACHEHLDRAEQAASNLPARLQAMVQHRRAAAFLFEADEIRALAASELAVKLLGKVKTGAFAARCFNTHAECLHKADQTGDAEKWLRISLKIKRALGDRLGLQKGLILLADLLEKTHHAEAIAAADEALQLAVSTNDLFGQRIAHYRLRRLVRGDSDAQAFHMARIQDIENQLNQNKGSSQ